jgi:hypothetical protein
VIRKAAIWFSLLSTIYWSMVLAFGLAAQQVGMAALGLPNSGLFKWLIGAAPLLIYSAFSVLYFHAFAKRVLELARRRPEE